MRTITLMTDHRIGLLSDISYILGKSRINIEGLEVDVIGNKAIVNLTVRNNRKACEILKKNGFVAIEKEGELLVKVKNNGAKGIDLLREELLQKGITIENAQVICGDGKKEMLSIQVDRPRKANRLIPTLLPNLF